MILSQFARWERPKRILISGRNCYFLFLNRETVSNRRYPRIAGFVNSNQVGSLFANGGARGYSLCDHCGAAGANGWWFYIIVPGVRMVAVENDKISTLRRDC